MQTRKLGSFEVSAIGLGCMSMSFGYGRPDAAEAERSLLRALEVGYTFLDTASVYGLGHNEKLIGRVLGGRRDEFLLASKCGIQVTEEGGRRVDCTPANIRATCEASLANLGTEVIDLYYLHRRDHTVPIEESVGALAELVAEGKIRAIGLSEMSSTTIRRAHAVHPVTAVQSEYSLWTRDPEHRVLATCEELGIGFVPFSPVARGFLTGTLSAQSEFGELDMRRNMPRFKGDNYAHNLALLGEYREIAADNGCTPAQLALAWVLSRGETLVPIPGTRHVAYVEENAAAADLEIPATELERAGELISPLSVAGARYAPEMEISLDPEED
jgi:aryl-alcohol dehydrogenase-like predicted oxidoreductase